MDYTKMTFEEYINAYKESLEESKDLISNTALVKNKEVANMYLDEHLSLRWYVTKNLQVIESLANMAKEGRLNHLVSSKWSKERSLLSLDWKDRTTGERKYLDIPLYDRTQQELDEIHKITDNLKNYDRSKERLTTLYKTEEDLKQIEQWIEKVENAGVLPEKIRDGVLIPDNIAVIQTINELHHIQLEARKEEENSYRERDEHLSDLCDRITEKALELKETLNNFALENKIITKEESERVMPIEQARQRHDRI